MMLMPLLFTVLMTMSLKASILLSLMARVQLTALFLLLKYSMMPLALNQVLLQPFMRQ